MQIFKFGGASVKDAINIRNVGHILATFKEIEKVVVVSALGKTTNALEEVVNAYIDNNDDYNKITTFAVVNNIIRTIIIIVIIIIKIVTTLILISMINIAVVINCYKYYYCWIFN